MRNQEYETMFSVENTHFWYQGMKKISLALLQKNIQKYTHKKLKILDAGCGTGAAMQWLASFGDVAGFDISPLALRYCKKRGIKNIKRGGIENIPYPDNIFDIVICFDVLYHIKVISDTKAIQELYRVLKPGGILMLRVPAYNWLYGYHDMAVHGKHRYIKREIEELLLTNNFFVRKITYANMFLFPLSFLMRIIHKLFLKNRDDVSDVTSIHALLNKLLYIPLWVESKLIRYISIPFGLSIIAVGEKSKSS